VSAVGEALVAAARVREGDEVLDVESGEAGPALAALAAGATVVAVDRDPELVARARGREPGVEWLAGAPESLEFEDERFDCVLSAFGVMAAERPAVAAGELARVCTLGGRIAIAAWAGASAWGDQDALRDLWAPRGVRVDVARTERTELGAYLLSVGTKTG